MRKSGTEKPKTERAVPSTRLHRVTDLVGSETKGSGLPNALKRTRKPHFLEPYRLSPEGRSGLIAHLETISLGDTDSRELFASAVEYAIASSRPAKPRNAGVDQHSNAPRHASADERLGVPAKASAPARPGLPQTAGTNERASKVADDAPAAGAVSPGMRPNDRDDASEGRTRVAASPFSGVLSDLARAAEEVAGQLQRLDAASAALLSERLRLADPFSRTYDSTYLEAVHQEIARIARAATAPGAAATPTAPGAGRMAETPNAEAATAPMTQAAQRLVQRVADAFESCFEIRLGDGQARAMPPRRFLPILRRVAREAHVELPEDDADLIPAIESRKGSQA